MQSLDLRLFSVMAGSDVVMSKRADTDVGQRQCVGVEKTAVEAASPNVLGPDNPKDSLGNRNAVF